LPIFHDSAYFFIAFIGIILLIIVKPAVFVIVCSIFEPTFYKTGTQIWE